MEKISAGPRYMIDIIGTVSLSLGSWGGGGVILKN